MYAQTGCLLHFFTLLASFLRERKKEEGGECVHTQHTRPDKDTLNKFDSLRKSNFPRWLSVGNNLLKGMQLICKLF